ncbi:MAG: bifunctional UDP-N-acetylglucosamine diphosphorylase/glucosamine-1-phosphate N-acetyltransferase GlmU [Thermodesulfovibrionales bacterium]
MKLATVILAAGLGKRMKSDIPKVLHNILGKPMIQYVVDSIKGLGSKNNIIVIGPHTEGIKDTLAGYPVRFITQEKPLGTGDALKRATEFLEGFEGTVLVLNGDTPLIEASTLRRFLKIHDRKKDDISLISFMAGGMHSYGRIVREGGEVVSIIEDKDATVEQKKIREVNSGIYAIGQKVLDLLKEIKINKRKGEYYLTDIVGIAVKKGYRVEAYILGSEAELTGINTREELYNAGLYMRDRIIKRLLNKGITIMDKDSTFIHPDVKIGRDTIIYPNVFIEGRSVIGRGCIIYPNTRLVDTIVGDGVTIKDSTLIENSIIKDDAVIGPFAHLRPGSVIGKACKIGNFVEVKKSIVGKGTKASHLSYLGDAEIGSNVNIGAGTITCNYDGQEKHKTIIEDGVFVGSDTQLVAPVRIGRGAYIGAGSTITEDVPPGSLALSRVRQKNIRGWVTKRRKAKG